MDASPFADRSSRRTATVTISAPDASWHFFITSKLEYFPVPMINRDRKVRTALAFAPAARAGDTGGEGLLPPRRYGYVAGGAFALAGLGFGIVAGTEAARAQSATSARDSTQALGAARDHAATANLCYAMAGA